MSRWAFRLALVAASFAAACGGSSNEPAQVVTTTPDRGAELMEIPADARRRCLKGKMVEAACPELVPVAAYSSRSPIYDASFFLALDKRAIETFNLQWGGEYPGRPELNRPPNMVHLVVLASNGDALYGFELGRQAQAREGLVRQRRADGVRLGHVRWAQRPGDLILAPPYPAGGILGNHLAFRWREGAISYAITLHAWEPFPETVATLRAIVESVPARR